MQASGAVKRGRPPKPRTEERPPKKKRGRPPKQRPASPPAPDPDSDHDSAAAAAPAPALPDTKTFIFRKVSRYNTFEMSLITGIATKEKEQSDQ